MKTQIEIQNKLTEIEQFCKNENYTTEEMQGEIQAFKYALDILGEDW